MTLVLTRATKQAARYTDAGGRERCSGCRFFMPQGTCGRIIGPVSPHGWCRFFSQEASQRFQPGAIPAGAALPGPTLDLSFMTQGALPSGLTFTRATTATYTDVSGTVQNAAINAPRWDYDITTHTLRGLLVEEPRTNLMQFSAGIGTAPWTVLSNTGAAPVVTQNVATAPDGTTTATRIVFDVVSAAGTSGFMYQGFTATAAAYTHSVYLRGNAGGEQLYLGTSGPPYTSAPRITLTTQWQRFTYTTPVLTAATWYFELGTDLRDATQTATAAQTIFCWGAQVEPGGFASSYIPTTSTAVTRAIDVCSMPPANMGWFTAPGGSWFGEFINLNPTPVTSRRVIGLSGSTAGASPLLVSPTRALGQDDGTLLSSANLSVAGAVTKGASTWAAGSARNCLNAGAVASSAGLATGYGALTAAGIYFLANSASAADSMSGYIRVARYWNRVMSDAEMQSVTT